MKLCIIPVVLTATVLFGTSLSIAAETKAEASQAASAVNATHSHSKSQASAKHKSAAPIKLIDINSAKKEELKKLPGVTDAEADKIIAGRPFGSKAWLFDKGILTAPTYQVVKDKIVCALTKKDIDTIMAKAKAKK